MTCGCFRMECVEKERLGFRNLQSPQTCLHSSMTPGAEQWTGNKTGSTMMATETMFLQTFTAHGLVRGIGKV